MALRILLSGRMAGVPGQGGATWAILQYALGFRQLGHQVALVEPVDSTTPEVVAYFRRVVDEFGLDAALLVAGTRETVGSSYEQVLEAAQAADVLVNVSGILREEALLKAPVRVYLDLDPAFNQLWYEDGIEVGLDGHTHFVTVGQALGQAPGGGTSPALTATESRVTADPAPWLCEVIANPASSGPVMVSAWVEPGIAVQVLPSGEVYAV